jgi:hypothetical protein
MTRVLITAVVVVVMVVGGGVYQKLQFKALGALFLQSCMARYTNATFFVNIMGEIKIDASQSLVGIVYETLFAILDIPSCRHLSWLSFQSQSSMTVGQKQ